MRVTRPRLAVLAAVRDHPHADTSSIIAAVRQDLGAVSHQAAYDVLRALSGAGLLRRIEPPGSVPRYELRVGDNHHHLVCRRCGVIVDVDCAVGTTPCLTASDDHGFSVDEARSSTGASAPPAPPPYLQERKLMAEHNAVVGDMNSEESEGVCPVVGTRVHNHPTEGCREP